MSELTRYYLFVFGALTIIGGVMGFIQAASKASLIAGGLSGALLLLAGFLMGEHPNAAAILALVVSVALAARFVPAFIRTKKAMPAGLMSLLSVLGIVLCMLFIA